MSFDAAFVRTVGLEGGYANNPADSGGETNWGITIAVARAHGYQGAMRAMSIDEAKAIYQDAYWNLIHLDRVDRVSASIAAEMFDTAVNCGVSIPGPFLQRALNVFNRGGKDYPDMPADGLIGTITLTALAAYLKLRGADGEKVLLTALNAQQAVRYCTIAEAVPKDEEFVFGWLKNRVAL